MDHTTLSSTQLDELLRAERQLGYQLALREHDSLSVPPIQPSAVYQYRPVEAPRTKFDPTAQKLVGGGVFLTGVGAASWGLSLFVAALAQATTALGLLVALVGMLCFLKRSGSNGTNSAPVNVSVNVRQQNRR